MLTTTDPQTLFTHAAMQLAKWDYVSPAEQAKYVEAIEALEGVSDPLERAETLHRIIGPLWGAPPWEDMQGPERAAYMFAAGSRAPAVAADT